jgi:hypothetical protein
MIEHAAVFCDNCTHAPRMRPHSLDGAEIEAGYSSTVTGMC